MKNRFNLDPIDGAFSGRETDVKFGIWGSIADQLGKSSQFQEYYAPLKAPGQTAWENLLKNECVLILLDELPAYLQNARSITIGNSDLAEVTAIALANLLVAVNRECHRVCVVLTDLRGAYQQGTEMISEVLKDFEQEANRSATPIEPVHLNTDEFYHILRTRLFEQLPTEQEVADIAQGYKQALEDARQMEITSESPAQAAAKITSSYPFHPKIRDLYARFRENPGYQQTRALIRLMRIVVARLWDSGLARQRHLIAAHDLDFNDRCASVRGIGGIGRHMPAAPQPALATAGSIFFPSRGRCAAPMVSVCAPSRSSGVHHRAGGDALTVALYARPSHYNSRPSTGCVCPLLEFSAKVGTPVPYRCSVARAGGTWRGSPSKDWPGGFGGARFPPRARIKPFDYAGFSL